MDSLSIVLVEHVSLIRELTTHLPAISHCAYIRVMNIFTELVVGC